MAGLTARLSLDRRRRRRAVLAASLIVLALAATACGGVPKPRATTVIHHLSGASRHGRYLVTCTTPGGAVALGRPQTWTVRVTTPAGAPVDRLRLGFNIDMPQMSMAPAPAHTVTAAGQGRYLVRGVEFTMGGHWVVTVTIGATTSAAADSATFSLQIG